MSKKNAPSVLNRIKPGTNAAFNVIFIILSLMCVLPIVLIFIISITDEQSIAQNGYQIIPDMLSASAYSFLWGERAMILPGAVDLRGGSPWWAPRSVSCSPPPWDMSSPARATS